ncbi:MAG: translation initiation factor IF-3 [Sedimentisphaerales bacterium]|nr:translation initiation factor IF-3 [Sedimentisphaerales bacterium]
MNEQIRIPQVRVIDQDNQQIGVINTAEAQMMAREVGLDLVEVAPKSVPPVCRIMDYGKWKYEQKKKEHKARQKQHQISIKEVRLRPKIDKHDQEFKLKNARQFLEKGHKVQFTMLFRGREMAHTNLARDMFNEIIAGLSDIAKVESPAGQQGRRMIMIMAPEVTVIKEVSKSKSGQNKQPEKANGDQPLTQPLIQPDTQLQTQAQTQAEPQTETETE